MQEDRRCRRAMFCCMQLCVRRTAVGALPPHSRGSGLNTLQAASANTKASTTFGCYWSLQSLNSGVDEAASTMRSWRQPVCVGVCSACLGPFAERGTNMTAECLYLMESSQTKDANAHEAQALQVKRRRICRIEHDLSDEYQGMDSTSLWKLGEGGLRRAAGLGSPG